MPSGTGAQSNEKGDFSFKIPIKDRELSIDHIGHENITLNAIIFKNGTVVQLKEKGSKLTHWMSPHQIEMSLIYLSQRTV